MNGRDAVLIAACVLTVIALIATISMLGPNDHFVAPRAAPHAAHTVAPRAAHTVAQYEAHTVAQYKTDAAAPQYAAPPLATPIEVVMTPLLAGPILHMSSDVDPLVTGMRYAGRDRSVYAERTSHGDEWGLEEYNDGNPGEVGVDIGPGRSYDDGIPATWGFPSTPVQWYSAIGEDYYGSEGPTVHGGQGLEMLSVGDHQPLEN